MLVTVLQETMTTPALCWISVDLCEIRNKAYKNRKPHRICRCPTFTIYPCPFWYVCVSWVSLVVHKILFHQGSHRQNQWDSVAIMQINGFATANLYTIMKGPIAAAVLRKADEGKANRRTLQLGLEETVVGCSKGRGVFGKGKKLDDKTATVVFQVCINPPMDKISSSPPEMATCPAHLVVSAPYSAADWPFHLRLQQSPCAFPWHRISCQQSDDNYFY